MEWIHTEHLSKIYGSGENAVNALNEANISIERGEFVAICGASGSGKSTLLNLLGAVDRPSSGNVIIDGTDITKKSEEQLAAFRRRRIGFIFQFFNLIPVLSVEENIAVPLMLDGRHVDKKEMNRVLKLVGLEDKRGRLPAQLSGGQQQRVAIARALIHHPALILADEPTGNLDSRTSREIVALLRQSVNESGQTLVLITHDPQVAAQADRVIHITDGRVEMPTGAPYGKAASAAQPPVSAAAPAMPETSGEARISMKTCNDGWAEVTVSGSPRRTYRPAANPAARPFPARCGAGIIKD